MQFVWLAPGRVRRRLHFIFEETEHGWVWAHAYQFEAETATFIVECSGETWGKWGFGDMTREQSIAACGRIFARHLGGQRLMSSAGHLRGSAWINFPRVLCERWSYKNLALLGDASASAHFSIGSGTKLALESAVALADYLHSEPSLEAAFDRYESARRTEVLRLQSAARNSLEWFEDVERYLDLDPVQFNYSLLTRSQRISHENLRLRDPAWLGGAEAWFQHRSGNTDNVRRAPMFAPFRLRELSLKNRVVVSPMAQYKAVGGCPTDWHFAHYAERAKGGAGLIYIEMTCVSPEGRITPGCTGMYAPEHEAAWKRIVDFVHAETEARSAQIGHSGGKGRRSSAGSRADAPLPAATGPVMRPPTSGPPNQVPRPMDRADMARIMRNFVASAEMAALRLRHAGDPRRAWLSLSSFITLLTNRRIDPNTAGRWRTAALSAGNLPPCARVWPAQSRSRCASPPTTGSATRATPAEAVEIARLLQAAGVDICDVSAGQTSIHARPVYGRMFQTPFSDRIRNETGMATMAVGNIYEPDHVNSILLAGRADLVCLARPHLADPYWTLHAAVQLGDRDVKWPDPYLAGRDQLYRLAERSATTGSFGGLKV
jgi:anthraniloyl-CoA monooxygenase